jgi:hypothetical protein
MRYEVRYFPPPLEGHVVATLWTNLKETGEARQLTEKELRLYDTLTDHLAHIAAVVEIREEKKT